MIFSFTPYVPLDDIVFIDPNVLKLKEKGYIKLDIRLKEDALFAACKDNISREEIELLLKVCPRKEGFYGAMSGSNIELGKWLLEQGECDINKALLFSCRDKKSESIEYLISIGADPSFGYIGARISDDKEIMGDMACLGAKYKTIENNLFKGIRLHDTNELLREDFVFCHG